ncbi:hypothetical protein ACVWWO_007641 [Bradyrhizobium sp. F1.13.1]
MLVRLPIQLDHESFYVSVAEKATTMIDDDLVRAHRNNIQRYHLLLQTTLTDFERQYVERRLSEEQSKLDRVTTRAQAKRDGQAATDHAG